MGLLAATMPELPPGLCPHWSGGWPVKQDWAALTQQIKEASDIVAVVGGYISLRPAGPTFKGLCPFHDDKHPSLDVDPRRQRYRCWACSKAGCIPVLVNEQTVKSEPEA